jgi:hypothetical protein
MVAGEPLPSPYNNTTEDFSDTVIIASGSEVAAAAIVRRDQMPGSKLVQLLHPRVSLDRFDVTVTPRHDFRAGDAIPPRVVTTSGSLHDITPEALAAHLKTSPSPDITGLPRPLISVLLGGPRGAWYWQRARGWHDDDAMQLSRGLLNLAGLDGSVVVTKSRRTPEGFERRLQRELQARLGTHRVLFDDGSLRSRYLAILAASDALVVTRDSVNMISEAVACGAAVFVTGNAHSSRLDRFVKGLFAASRVRPLEDDDGRLIEGIGSVPVRLRGETAEDSDGSGGREREVDRVAKAVLSLLAGQG